MNTNSLATLPLAQLKRVVRIREQIESLHGELNQLLGSAALAANGVTSHRRNGLSVQMPAVTWQGYSNSRGMQPKIAGERLSAAGRAKISAVVSARWERYR